jgi:hypothetical protein
MRARPRSLSGQSGTGTPGLIATSGWVMKKTVGIEPLALAPSPTRAARYRSAAFDTDPTPLVDKGALGGNPPDDILGCQYRPPSRRRPNILVE